MGRILPSKNWRSSGRKSPATAVTDAGAGSGLGLAFVMDSGVAAAAGAVRPPGLALRSAISAVGLTVAAVSVTITQNRAAVTRRDRYPAARPETATVRARNPPLEPSQS